MGPKSDDLYHSPIYTQLQSFKADEGRQPLATWMRMPTLSTRNYLMKLVGPMISIEPATYFFEKKTIAYVRFSSQLLSKGRSKQNHKGVK